MSDNFKEYEFNNQKRKLKELNAIDTSKEDLKEIQLAIDEILNTLSQEELLSIREQNKKNREIIENLIGKDNAFPLKAIEKLLPFIKKLTEEIANGKANKRTINIHSYACDYMATLSRDTSLIPTGTSVPSSAKEDFELSELESMNKEEILKKWNRLFTDCIEEIESGLSEHDNIKICADCQRAWQLSNISSIFL